MYYYVRVHDNNLDPGFDPVATAISTGYIMNRLNLVVNPMYAVFNGGTNSSVMNIGVFRVSETPGDLVAESVWVGDTGSTAELGGQRVRVTFAANQTGAQVTIPYSRTNIDVFRYIGMWYDNGGSIGAPYIDAGNPAGGVGSGTDQGGSTNVMVRLYHYKLGAPTIQGFSYDVNQQASNVDITLNAAVPTSGYAAFYNLCSVVYDSSEDGNLPPLSLGDFLFNNPALPRGDGTTTTYLYGKVSFAGFTSDFATSGFPAVIPPLSPIVDTVDDADYLGDLSAFTRMTVPLSYTGYGGKLEYSLSEVNTVPTTGWIDPTLNTFLTVDRGTKYYYWARRGPNYYTRSPNFHKAPYRHFAWRNIVAGTPFGTPNIIIGATSTYADVYIGSIGDVGNAPEWNLYGLVVAGGDVTDDTYETRDEEILYTSLSNSIEPFVQASATTSSSLIIRASTNLPTIGNTTTYHVFAAAKEIYGGPGGSGNEGAAAWAYTGHDITIERKGYTVKTGNLYNSLPDSCQTNDWVIDPGSGASEIAVWNKYVDYLGRFPEDGAGFTFWVGNYDSIGTGSPPYTEAEFHTNFENGAATERATNYYLNYDARVSSPSIIERAAAVQEGVCIAPIVYVQPIQPTINPSYKVLTAGDTSFSIAVSSADPDFPDTEYGIRDAALTVLNTTKGASPRNLTVSTGLPSSGNTNYYDILGRVAEVDGGSNQWKRLGTVQIYRSPDSGGTPTGVTGTWGVKSVDSNSNVLLDTSSDRVPKYLSTVSVSLPPGTVTASISVPATATYVTVKNVVPEKSEFDFTLSPGSGNQLGQITVVKGGDNTVDLTVGFSVSEL